MSDKRMSDKKQWQLVKLMLSIPALHMMALGALLFASVEHFGDVLLTGKPRLEVAQYRLQQAREEFVQTQGRQPAEDEWEKIYQALLDEELLLDYALSLRLYEDTAVQARLALIAQFVNANPDAATQAELSQSAIDLGLHTSDLVARRILVDRARRMIRSVVLMHPVPQERAEQYFKEHSAEYVQAPRIRLAHIAVNTFKWSDTESRAHELRDRIGREKLDFASAMTLGDASPVPATLPLGTARELASRMGPDFAAAVFALPSGQWSAPIASRFGDHLVYVQERQEAQTRSLAEVRVQVEQEVRQQLADEWLGQRLEQMRSEYEIVPEGGVS